MIKKNAESLSHMFICIIIVVAPNTTLNLLLSYPIRGYPLPLAHCDGTRVKTLKAILVRS